AVQGVGGTRDCDWFFSTEGVLLDTAGRYSTQRDDRPEWLEFLKLLKKYRSKAPVNGILVAVSFPELVQYNSEQFALYARQVRERINEIDNVFGIKVPIYLIFTKIDLLGGFAQFFEDLTDEQRQQVWGATITHDQGSEFDAKRAVAQQFDDLYRGLVQIGSEKLANNRGNAKRPALFAFPIEFNGMRDAIGKFVELLFQDDPYHSKPLLRGFYFTSALQEGTPRIAAGNRVSSQFDLSRPGFDAAQLPASNGFFLRKLFQEVLFPDQYLIARQMKPGSAKLRLAGIAAGMLVLTVATGLLTWSYVGNQKLIADANEELLVARRLSDSSELVDQLKALQVMQLRLEQLYSYRKEGHPFLLGLQLYQGDKVERALRAEYFNGVKNLMLAPVAKNLEHTLAGLQMTSATTVNTRATLPDAPTAIVPSVPKRVPQQKTIRPRSPGGGLPVIPIEHRVGDAHGAHKFMLAPYRPGSEAGAVLVQSAGAPNNFRQAAGKHVLQSIRSSVPAGGHHAGTQEPVEQNPLENGYNALKTYLMLKQKERMEVAHLSDQVPKYWRTWLDANKGKATQEEINRLAERVIVFYVSQVQEPDLPLIENREELVAASRDVLRGALHKLSAKERVYNELKARANTQFAPMTVGRILNNTNLNVVAGSYALPGAFTREAWDKYFRQTIIDASKGEVKGDDWVLAATTEDNLGTQGDFERNRADLEALYKADYVREWKKFLQGVAVQDFGTLDNTAQSLAKLADAQNSAIKLILAKAAYETAWDNPSQLTKSLSSAKDSVLARTERLVLGTTPAPTPGASVQLGEVGSKFATLATMTATAEGGRSPLSAYLDVLAKLKVKVGLIAA
ncbi:type VI secretion protein IcmF/TssM N-terminal domain-containing protein, partial [Noviherbaspirillum sp.]|uniref:type VI secretion protein IcmF/TssM N-terminal domain-containing protein n=1 Tax=Noviherbaspirillum sp. TaxID=1926288 RepID=UPI002FE04824